MAQESAGKPAPADQPTVLNDDGGWCWFQDERAIVVGDWLCLGTVATGSKDRARAGDIDLVRYNLRSRALLRTTLREGLQADDHAAPALLALPNGRVLAMYTKHGNENRIYYRTVNLHDSETGISEERIFIPSESSRVTYSNLYRLGNEAAKRGRLYDFFRGYDNSFKPSWAYSDDEGDTWKPGGVLIDFPHEVKQRPYAKYASNGRDTVHILFTEAHPRNFDNSIYHAYYRAGKLYRSDGTAIKELRGAPITPDQATKVFAGNANNVAWSHDIALDSRGRPYAVYSVQKDSAGLPSGPAGRDLRYRYGRWDGKRWRESEIAHAGERLYAGEDDYAGGISVHPDDPNVVFISSNVDPVTGGKVSTGRYEIYRGETRDSGVTWTWTPVTKDSTSDNLRPIVPKWKKGKTLLLWLRGRLRAYTDYDLEVVMRRFG